MLIFLQAWGGGGDSQKSEKQKTKTQTNKEGVRLRGLYTILTGADKL